METRARYVLVGLFLLAVIAAGFGFVYWLENRVGSGEQAVYRIRFEEPVSGLRPGSFVLFNGIRVGEVVDLRLDRSRPREVTATIAVDRATPIRADTEVSVEVQGLVGTPVITLRGGDPAAPAPAVAGGGEPPVIVAGPAAAQSVMQAARDVLRRLNAVVVENSEPLKNAIANIDTFTAALARNSDRIDGIAEGLSRMLGAQAKGPATVFDLTAVRGIEAAPKTPGAQLVVAEPTAVLALDTQKIQVRKDSEVVDSLPDVQWSDTLPKLFQARVIQSFENADFMGVGKSSDAFMADRQLAIDIRAFRISMAPAPTAEVEFAAKLLANGQIVAARLFRAEVPVKGTDPRAAAAALDQAFMQSVKDLVGWTLAEL